MTVLHETLIPVHTAIGIATTAILIRCSFRVAELSGGFQSRLANNEVYFMVLDGAMMIIAMSVLTAAHPGPVLGSVWNSEGFHLRTRNVAQQLLESSNPDDTSEK